MASPIADVAFDHDGRTLTLRLDHMAIAHFERTADMSFIEAIMHVDDFVSGRKFPKISIIGYLLASALSRHHPDITLETAMEMGVDANILSALAKAFETAMPKSDPTDPLASAVKVPPKKKSGTGKAKSARGARQESA